MSTIRNEGSAASAPHLNELIRDFDAALSDMATAALKATAAKRAAGAPGDYGYNTPVGQALLALAELIWTVEVNLEIAEGAFPRIFLAQIDRHKAETAALFAQIRAAIDAPRYPGTPITPDQARTDSEKELVSILDGIAGAIDSMVDPAPVQTPLSLSFAALRGANIARLPTFKNAKGEAAHSEADGSDWALSGEACRQAFAWSWRATGGSLAIWAERWGRILWLAGQPEGTDPDGIITADLGNGYTLNQDLALDWEMNRPSYTRLAASLIRQMARDAGYQIKGNPI